VLSYKDALNQLKDDETRSILIANGFSQAWDANIFHYASLFESANFNTRTTEIRALFKASNTYDFEAIMRRLESAQVVLETYGADPDLIQTIEKDQEILKESLLDAIANTHPKLPSEVKDDQYVAVRTFLSGFKNVFSLNYDLLFYWARNKTELGPDPYKTDDGFRSSSTWNITGTNQNVYFLHGGLHIYEDGSDVRKHVYSTDGETIIEQVRKNLDKGKFPLFVSEPNNDKKKEKIDHNPYLRHAFGKLKELDHTLFIHGHSMDENDNHIFNQVKSSGVEKVYVSIFGDENTADNKRLKANAKKYLSSITVSVVFYQAETAPIWEKQGKVI
jgi:hypothetical protein